MQVAATSAGFPVGTVTLLDGNTPLGAATLSSSGLAVFSSITLAAGTHSLSAVYNGSTNFAPSTSPLQQITIASSSGSNPPPALADFALSATNANTQTITSGAAVTFTFSVQPQGNMASPVTLAVSGLPNLAIASFNPPTIPPASASTPFTLTIATPETTARIRPAPLSPPSPAWALLAVPFVGISMRRRIHIAKLLSLGILAAALLSVSGCGDRVNAVSLAGTAKTYLITVTGTSTTPTGSTLQHSAVVTLTLQPGS
ncbi:MAG: Ig-like domain repeat protein [Acidobacteriota bacterium]|nr:Ig-like domain repeat protein [Acidobacteriota bacterium]